MVSRRETLALRKMPLTKFEFLERYQPKISARRFESMRTVHFDDQLWYLIQGLEHLGNVTPRMTDGILVYCTTQDLSRFYITHLSSLRRCPIYGADDDIAELEEIPTTLSESVMLLLEM